MTGVAVDQALTSLIDLAGLKEEIGSRGSQPELLEKVGRALVSLEGEDLPEAVAGFTEAVRRYAHSGVEAPPVPPELHESVGEQTLDTLFSVAEDQGVGDLLVPRDLVPSSRGSIQDSLRKLVRRLLPQVIDEIEWLRAQSPTLPWRHRQAAIPGIVEPLQDDCNGLVHGGVILARDFRLVVKAYHHGQCTVKRARRRTVDVVAGVCEKQDFDGRVLETWTTAPKLGDRYASASVKLTRPHELPSGILENFETFYLPSSSRISAFRKFLGQPTEPVTDDGLPDPLYYLGRLRKKTQVGASASGFLRAPAPANAIENPYFQVTPAEPGLFAIDSPFVTVFVPGPRAENVLVSMVSCFREATLVGSGSRTRLKRFEREKTWEVRLFS